jgi:hypothetical protein
VSRRPHTPIAVGDTLRVKNRTLRVRHIAQRVEHGEGVVEHVTEVFTCRPRQTVVAMPVADPSVVAQFLRYHVLVRVFDGDPDAWLAELMESGGEDGDVRFVRWIRSRLRQDPALILSIRRMVDATPFWRAAQSSS